jgi:hypothetical protein
LGELEMVISKKGIAIVTLTGGLILGAVLLFRRKKKPEKASTYKRFGWSEGFLNHLAIVRESLKIIDEGALGLFDDKLFIIEAILEQSTNDSATEEICNALYGAMAARNAIWGLTDLLPSDLAENIFERQAYIMEQEMRVAASCKLHLDHGLDAVNAIMDTLRVKKFQSVKIA